MNQFSASLWGDESFAAVLGQKSIPDIVRIVSRDTSPPLYYFFLHTWIKIFGDSEIVIRTLSFLFFLATVFIVYLIGKSLWDKKTALLAATLTFVNPFLFQYAFEGRMYSLLLLTTTLSMYFYLKKNFWGYILATVAALYTHHFSIFAVFAQFLWSGAQTFKLKKSFFSLVGPYLIIGVAYLPWLYPLYFQTSLVASGFWLGKPTLKSVAEIFGSFFLGQNKQYLQIAVALSILMLFIWRKYGEWKKDGFLILWALLPIGLAFTISQFKSSIFYDRYLLYCLPPLILLLVSQRRLPSLTFIFLAIFSLAIINWRYFTHPTKRPFRELATYVKQNQKPEYGLINYNARAHHLFESKYYKLEAPLYIPEGSLPFYTGTALMEKGDIINTLPNKKKIMVITSAEPEEVSLPGYSLFGKIKFDNLYLLWFKR